MWRTVVAAAALALGLAAVGLGANSTEGLRAVPGDQRSADRDAIRAHIDKIFQAYMKKDRATIQATHSADWRGFLNSSRRIVRGLDQYMQTADGGLRSRGFMAGYRFEDFDVIFYGDVGIVSYIADVDLDSGENPPQRIKTKYRSIDIYAKLDGEWMQVASHLDTHPDVLAARRQQPQPMTPAGREQLLKTREAVWRAWFANDRAQLEQMIPEDTIAINAGEEPWHDRASVLASAEAFANSGAKLVRLEFPKTEIRVYGDTAILYTTYLFETETQGKRETASGRGTEIFVLREGRWVNPGWHTDSGR